MSGCREGLHGQLSGRPAVARPSAPRSGDDRARRAAHRALHSRREPRSRDHGVIRLSRGSRPHVRQRPVVGGTADGITRP